ncbi:hypothetical protein CCMSSC00406_0006159 [Pleurotus cornucopiae]|uniref:Uncharacterized protein n=1 Tax=Pleurotus cornucopiae TaxID=5321 RepID=A0ACB7J967_PLECO|nr:hypothetical protein CCMSSC00406_0006159 [Pleurotus cornucopiae]
MSRRRSRKVDSDDEDNEDFSALMERHSSPPPYPPPKRPCHRAGTASVSSTAEAQTPPPGSSQSTPSNTTQNRNTTFIARQIAHQYRLHIAQVPELERFSLDPTNIMLLKVFAKLTSLENKMASMEAAAPDYSVSASLKVNIDKYAAGVLLSSKVIAYKGDPPTEQLLSILRKLRFDMPMEIERNPADWGKVITACQDSLTQLRSKLKKLIANSVKLPNTDVFLPDSECQDIYMLTKTLVANTSCKISAPLCARVALMVYIAKPGSDFWDKVDGKLRSIRRQAEYIEDRFQNVLKGTLSADKKKYGDVAGVAREHEPAVMVNLFQQTVDEIIELDSLTPAHTASHSPEPTASGSVDPGRQTEELDETSTNGSNDDITDRNPVVPTGGIEEDEAD